MPVTMEQVCAALEPDELNYHQAAVQFGLDALPYLERLVKGPNVALAVKATYLVSLIESGRSHMVLREAAQSIYPEVRVAVATGARNLDPTAANEILLLLLNDPDAGVVKTALKSLPIVASPAILQRLQALTQTHTEDFVRIQATQVLAQLRPTRQQEVVVAFPFSDTQIVVIFPEKLDISMANPELFRLRSGLAVLDARLDPESPNQLILYVEPMKNAPLTVDMVIVNDFVTERGVSLGETVSPQFIQGIQSAMQLKAPHFMSDFPFTSTLVGLHVSVACCTGCNGGIHDRNLVVLNHHIGGAWSGIWIRTGKTIEAPYPRWQRVLCAGGVVTEDNGSLLIVDRGWMVVQKQDETPHHAPPPLPIETADLPFERTTSLVCKSLDGAWVEFNNITVDSATWIEATEREPEAVNLPRNEIIFHDASGGRSMAWLYQPSGQKVEAGQQIDRLRGFVHAEEPGHYVVLSDKEEDIIGTWFDGKAP